LISALDHHALCHFSSSLIVLPQRSLPPTSILRKVARAEHDCVAQEGRARIEIDRQFRHDPLSGAT
jgi:hypothetical protein